MRWSRDGIALASKFPLGDTLQEKQLHIVSYIFEIVDDLMIEPRMNVSDSGSVEAFMMGTQIGHSCQHAPIVMQIVHHVSVLDRLCSLHHMVTNCGEIICVPPSVPKYVSWTRPVVVNGRHFQPWSRAYEWCCSLIHVVSLDGSGTLPRTNMLSVPLVSRTGRTSWTHTQPHDDCHAC